MRVAGGAVTAALASLMALVARVDAVRPRPTGSPPLRVTSDRIERGAEWAVAINDGRSAWIESYGASEEEACAKARARFVDSLEDDARRAATVAVQTAAAAERAAEQHRAAQAVVDAARSVTPEAATGAALAGEGR